MARVSTLGATASGSVRTRRATFTTKAVQILEGRTRRWVIYNGVAEASSIPPGWHGWMHHRVDVAPSQENYKPRAWQKPHEANLTGSAAAYRPKGSLAHGSHRPQVTGDYDAWTPGG